jgi:hypothetical protein
MPAPELIKTLLVMKLPILAPAFDMFNERQTRPPGTRSRLEQNGMINPYQRIAHDADSLLFELLLRVHRRIRP